MGVFALFRRKSKEAAEASTDEDRTVTLTADEETAEEMTGAENVTSRPSGAASEPFEDAGTDAYGMSDEEPAQEPAEPSGHADTAGAGESAEAVDLPANGDVAEAPEAVEVVDIPKQQSAEEAADNEAGESART
ncbi:hypothetical protein ABZZ37_15070 [Streptomyces sp. NPDC006464]|uniref:hypothetical protein n=1 Tax=unclassified Streptomyces TaxID=2593676 RepID=UPI0033BE17A3